MQIVSFKKTYEVDLIPASTGAIIVGNLVWDPLIGSPKFSHDGMPLNIFQAFLDAELISRKEFDLWIELCRQTPSDVGKFANIVVDVDIDTAAELNFSFGKFLNDFSFEKVKKFEFGAITSKLMTYDVRIIIDAYLEKMREKKWKDYDGKLRRLFVIKELFYGESVKVTIDSEFKEEFEAKLDAYPINAKILVDSKISKTYEFLGNETPFAMRTGKVKNFNG